MNLYNKTKACLVVEHVESATNKWSRMKGLLGKDGYPNRALIIQPCNQVHTLFMRFAIDVLFIDSNNKVIAIERMMKPWAFSKKQSGAVAVIEAEAGVFLAPKVGIGDVLVFKKVD